MSLRGLGLSIMLMACCGATWAQSVGGADLVVLGGKVWTGVEGTPETQAIAIRGSRILATGSDEAILKLALPGAKIVRLHGERVVPAFNDSHVHIQMGGVSRADGRVCEDDSQGQMDREWAVG
jgi:predicted amidohydrolase YtcJ